jgi:uncharacterized 2Fe-2S/4Fe-4S cluster protein (DUF4445 family)
LRVNGRLVPVTSGETIFDAAGRAGIRIPTSCVTLGKCRECMVEVTSGMSLLSEPSVPERHLAGTFRLSCQAHVVGDAGTVECQTLRRGRMKIEHAALGLPVSGRPFALDPAVTRKGDRILIDGEEIDRSTGPIHGLAMDVGTTTVVEEIDRSTGPIHGLAMDVGTTTVVVRLYDLETGERVADNSFENPQRFGGSDVMSRIHYDTGHPGRLLMRTLAGYLTHAIEELPVDPRTIYEVVLVGNSTMRDLFFRQSVYAIGQSPYQSITEIEMRAGIRTSTSLVQSGRRSLLPIHPLARVYGAPIISGHVGADAAACLLGVDLAHEDRLVAVMDIGTNTELILGNRHRILAASCPAGPAFEGGAISRGMPGLDGAIEDVRIDDDGRFTIGVIGGGEPQGLCGSGLVDLLGELVRTGRMNPMGRFEDGADHVTVDAARDIRFLESDVNELAQAKGANVAGLQVVFNTYGVRFEDVDVFYLAGGFGRHLKKDAARRIGLIPNLPDDRIVQVGNAAIEGASIALLSRTKRQELETVVRRVEHTRLETHPDFFDYFVDGCQFKPIESPVRVSG